METICPLCNGLQKVTLACPFCGTTLLDGGNIESFFGPYAPYAVNVQVSSENSCVHLLFCPHCHYDSRQAYQMVVI